MVTGASISTVTSGAGLSSSFDEQLHDAMQRVTNRDILLKQLKHLTGNIGNVELRERED